MGLACSFDDRTWLSVRVVNRIEASIGVGLEDPGVSGEISFGMLAALASSISMA